MPGRPEIQEKKRRKEKKGFTTEAQRRGEDNSREENVAGISGGEYSP